MDDFVSPGRLQVADDAVHRGLPHPGHHGFQIHAGAKMSGCERRPELVKPEIFWIQPGFRGVSLERSNHMRIGSSTPRAEDKRARSRSLGRERFSIDFERFEQLVGYRDLAFDLDESGKVKYHYVIIDYFVHVKNGVAQASSDAAELRWVPFDEVEDYDLTRSFRVFFRNNREKLEKYNSY